MRGVSLQFFICLEGSTSQEIMRESQSGTAFQAGRDGGISLSEGILSFVEYAPRLLIVLPSKQFTIYILITKSFILSYFHIKKG